MQPQDQLFSIRPPWPEPSCSRSLRHALQRNKLSSRRPRPEVWEALLKQETEHTVPRARSVPSSPLGLQRNCLQWHRLSNEDTCPPLCPSRSKHTAILAHYSPRCLFALLCCSLWSQLQRSFSRILPNPQSRTKCFMPYRFIKLFNFYN